MSRFRYLIERGPEEQTVVELEDGRVELRPADLYLTSVTPTDPDGHGTSGPYTLEQAKALATRSAASFMDVEETPLRWKDAPAAWQPDALLVSQYLDDGVKEARDD